MSSNGENQKPKRTIDERIDALIMSSELHAGMLRDLDANMEKLTVNVESMRAGIAELTATSKRDVEIIRLLTRIAEGHEHRIQSLEGDRPA